MTEDTSYSVPVRADGFTPMFDEVVNDLGTTAAAVYGVVWRHCQMRRKVCDASKPTMSRLTGLCQRTIKDWLVELVKAGYIVDVTEPGKKGIPHTYVCTNKVTLAVSLAAGTRAPSAPGAPEGTRALDARGDALDARVPVQEMHGGGALDAPKDTIRIPSKETSKRQSSSSSSEKSPESEEPPPEEEEEGIAFFQELVDLGMRKKDAREWAPIIGDHVPGWLVAVRDKTSPVGYLLSCWRNGDVEPPAKPRARSIATIRNDEWSGPGPGGVVSDAVASQLRGSYAGYDQKPYVVDSAVWNSIPGDTGDVRDGICADPECNARRTICPDCGHCQIEHCECGDDVQEGTEQADSEIAY